MNCSLKRLSCPFIMYFSLFSAAFLKSFFFFFKTDEQKKLNDKNEHREKNKFEVKIIILKHTRPLRVSGPDVRFSFFILLVMVIRPIIDNRRTLNFWSLSFMFFIKSIWPPGPYRPLKRKMTEQIWCMMDDGAFMWLRVMELMIRSWVDFQLGKLLL